MSIQLICGQSPQLWIEPTLTHGVLWEFLWIIRTPQGLGKDWARTVGGPNEEPPAKCAISSPPPVHLQSSPHGLVHMESPGGSGLHKDGVNNCSSLGLNPSESTSIRSSIGPNYLAGSRKSELLNYVSMRFS